MEVAVAPATAERRLDVPMDGLHHAQRNRGPAVAEDSFPMIRQHIRQLLHRFESLPT